MHLEKKKEKRQRRTQEKNAQMCDGTGYSFIKKKTHDVIILMYV